MCKLVKLLYYQNYCSDSNGILNSDKDHKVLFVGHSSMHPTNPRWHTATIFQKGNTAVSQKPFEILMKLCTVTVTHTGPPVYMSLSFSNIKKSKLSDKRHLKTNTPTD